MKLKTILGVVILLAGSLAFAESDVTKLDENLKARLSSEEGRTKAGQIKILQEAEPAYEAALKDSYARALGLITDPDSRKEFDQIQVKWLLYRANYLKLLESSIKKLTSVEWGLEYRSRIDLLRHRIDELDDFYVAVGLLLPDPPRVGFSARPGT